MKTVKIMAYILAVIVQSLLIIAVFVVEALTSKKAGVMHHVYYRRYQFEQGILANDSLTVQSIIIFLLGIAMAIILILAYKKKKSKFARLQIVLCMIVIGVLLFIINSKLFFDMIAYPYFIFVFEIVLAIQLVVVILSNLKKDI